MPAAHRLAVLLLVVAASLGVAVLPASADDLLLAQDESPTPSPSPEATEDEEEERPAFGGTLRNAEGPVEGVTVTVTDADGAEVGSAQTDADGQWEVPVPGPGSYTVMIDPETLPEGVTLRDPDRASIETSVRPGDRRTIAFPLGEGADVAGLLRSVSQAVTNGLKFGLIVAMTAVGLSLIFGTTGLINFAHGELVAFGAIAAWFLNVNGGIHLVPAALLAMVLGGLLGGGLDLGLWRPLRRRQVGLFQMLIITIGLSLFIRFGLLGVFGGSRRPYADFVGQQVMRLGPVAITPRDLTIMALAVVVLVAVATMLQRTRLGKAMRAVADNRDLAESSGIDVQRVVLMIWVGGASLAALGGVLYGSVITVDYRFGFQLLLLMFAGVILGGLGTAYGAMVGSLVIGLVTELSTLWSGPELKFAWALGVLVIVLLLRPQGILGRRERIG